MNRIMLAVILGLVLFAGCPSEPPDGVIAPNNTKYNIRHIEGCEYIEVSFGIGDTRVYSLTHKGNCCNPIHKGHVERE